MKTRFVILLFLSILGCDDNDDDKVANEPTINGAWNLTNVSGGFAGVDDDFSQGTIMWNFNQETSILTVVNNNQEEVIFDGLDSGTYSYSISIENETFVLYIESNAYGDLSITENDMTIDQGLASDGFLLTFER